MMLGQITFKNVNTRFINQEAMLSMINFGKGTFDEFAEIKINDELDLNLYHYYRQGTWGIY